MSNEYPPQNPGQYPQQPGAYAQPQYQQQPQQYQQQYQQQQAGYPQQAAASMPGAGGYSTRIQEAIAMVDLLAGEQVVYAIQADGFFLGTNPLLKLMASIQSFMTTITGGHIRIFLVVTNQRVLVIKSIQFMCGCQRAKSVDAIALAGVKEAGMTKDTQACCINTRIIWIRSLARTFALVVKKMNDQEIRSFLTNISSVIVAHSARAGV